MIWTNGVKNMQERRQIMIVCLKLRPQNQEERADIHTERTSDGSKYINIKTMNN